MMVGDETIGAIGISGAPGGDKDEAGAKDGLDKVAPISNSLASSPDLRRSTASCSRHPTRLEAARPHRGTFFGEVGVHSSDGMETCWSGN
jgi:hypothetical protein